MGTRIKGSRGYLQSSSRYFDLVIFRRMDPLSRVRLGAEGGVATGRKQREAQADHLLGFEARLPEVEGKTQPG